MQRQCLSTTFRRNKKDKLEHAIFVHFESFSRQPNKHEKTKMRRKNDRRRRDNSQKASSGDWKALRLTLTTTGLASVGLAGDEELSTMSAIGSVLYCKLDLGLKK